MTEDESTKDLFEQLGLYTVSSITATIVNIVFQILFRMIFLVDGEQFYDLFLVIGSALAIGYTVKYFMDCYITFKKQRKEDSRLYVQYLVYMGIAVVYYFLNTLIQIGLTFLLDPLIIAMFLGTLGLFLTHLARLLIPLGLSIILVWILKFPVDKFFTFKYF
ncbi:MAG: hypothetical protein ACTSRW_04920 [Candidatus Helarchaeota archaeon]